jgi:hypothetical protein
MRLMGDVTDRFCETGLNETRDPGKNQDVPLLFFDYSFLRNPTLFSGYSLFLINFSSLPDQISSVDGLSSKTRAFLSA